MLRSLTTHVASAQQWLSVQLQRGDQSTTERERVRQDAFDALQLVERASLGFDYLQSADVVVAHLRVAQTAIATNLADENPGGDDFRDWHLLGRLHEHLGEYDRAYRCYNKAFSLVPPTESSAYVRRDFGGFLANTSQSVQLLEQLYGTKLLAGTPMTDRGTPLVDSKTAIHGIKIHLKPWRMGKSSVSHYVITAPIRRPLSTLTRLKRYLCAITGQSPRNFRSAGLWLLRGCKIGKGPKRNSYEHTY